MTDPVNTERPTEPLAQKAATARAELLQLMAEWGLKTGHGSREHADRILNRHAHELAEQQRALLRSKGPIWTGTISQIIDRIDPEAKP
ncbi:hypothetical protein ACFZB5_13735 [Streptomyces nodosus]|uniref:hypothetical protein n=1 Tax=Streptomyces nodosus TaxID=40318 RepID=UPI0036EF936E